MTGGRRFALGVLAVTLAAAGLRAAGLGAWSFAADELGTFHEIDWFFHPPEPMKSPDEAVPRAIPVAMLALDAGHRAFGRSEAGCRVVPAVCGVLHVALAAVGLAAAGLSRAAALAAGVLLAVAGDHLFYSQYHRFYTLAALAAGAALIAAGRAVRTGSGGWAAAACALAGVGVLTHTLVGAVFGVIAAGTIAAALAGGRWRPAGVAVGGAVVAAGVFMFVLWPIVGAKSGLTGFGGLSTRHALLAAAVQAGWPVCVLAALGLAVLWHRDRPAAAFWGTAAAGWAGAAAVLPAVLPYHSAYSFPLALPAFALAGVAVAEVAGAVRPRGRAAAGLAWVGLMALTLPTLVSYYQDGSRPDLRAAAAYLAAWAGPDDLLVSNEPETIYHYLPAGGPVWLDVRLNGDLGAAPRDPGRRLWVVCSGGRNGFVPAWREWVLANGRLHAVIARPRYDYHEYAVWVFAVPGRP